MREKFVKDGGVDKLALLIQGVSRPSLGLTLPIEMVRELGWRERQPAFASAVAKAMADKKATADKKVVVKRVRGGVVGRDWKK